MRQLRDDLILALARDGKQLLVRDPKSGATFEFGEQEAFLIKALRASYDPKELMAAFNARFGVNDDTPELQEFLDILENWGLLAVESGLGGRLSKLGKPLLPTPRLSAQGAEGQESTGNAARAPPSAEEDEQSDEDFEIQRNNRWHLFQPERVLDALDKALSPLQGLVWLIPILIVYSIAAVWFNRYLVADSIADARLLFGLIGRIAFVTLTINLAIQLLRGVVARHYGMPVPSFGIVLAFGLIPRFNTQIIPAPGSAKSERVWLISTSLLVRLVLFGVGVTLWLVTRPSGSLLSTVGAELALVSAVGFLFMANPLWGGDGYNLLSVLMGAPNLRQQAKGSLRALFTGRPRVVAQYAKDSLFLAAFAAASVAFPAALVAFIALSAARRLESNFQGAGVALFLVIFIHVVRNVLLRRARLRKQAKQRRAGVASIQGRVAAQGTPGLFALAPRARAVGQGATDDVFHSHAARKSTRLRYLVTILLIATLFLPYSYETGGEAEIFPIAQHEIHAEADGVIEQVRYRGGEWVSQGTVVAEMANHRQKKDVMVTQASIQAKERDIDRLRSTPSVESIRLAEEQLATARLELRYSVEEVDRIEKLFTKGMVSLQSFDDAKKQRDLHRQAVEEKRASLEALKAQINPNEIASAQAELQKLREDLIFYEEQLRRTRLHMPVNGRIATTKLQDFRNKYLEEGQLFCAVEDTREVRVEIAVPEAEIHEVAVSDPVRLKTWAEPGRIFNGTIAEIAPQATEKTYGSVVMVIAILSNPDGALKTGMTGYAKIRGEETLVGIAFTKALVRFFLIEVWSWLP